MNKNLLRKQTKKVKITIKKQENIVNNPIVEHELSDQSVKNENVLKLEVPNNAIIDANIISISTNIFEEIQPTKTTEDEERLNIQKYTTKIYRYSFENYTNPGQWTQTESIEYWSKKQLPKLKKWIYDFYSPNENVFNKRVLYFTLTPPRKLLVNPYSPNQNINDK